MKKTLVTLCITALALFVFSSSFVQAAASLPSTPVSFAPAGAVAGSPITLNAFVYNNQSVDTTVTVSFTAPRSTTAGDVAIVATATATISAQGAQTISAAWKMPAQSTVVTAAVTAAINTKTKQSIASLLGTVGTVTVSSAPISVIPTSFPGSSQISAWFNPFFNSVEQFRIKEAAGFTTLRDTTKAAITSTPTGNPLNYATLIYSSVATPLFANQAIFYITAFLVLLLLLRFIVNLIF